MLACRKKPDTGVTSTRKYIFTHSVGYDNGKEKKYANAFLIPRNYDRSFEGYKLLVKEAKKDFPDLVDDEIHCGVVVDSTWCKGMPILRFPLPLGTTKDGYVQFEGRPDWSLA
jgi:hypothetical protein